jgi:hypothetical protein
VYIKKTKKKKKKKRREREREREQEEKKRMLATEYRRSRDARNGENNAKSCTSYSLQLGTGSRGQSPDRSGETSVVLRQSARYR